MYRRATYLSCVTAPLKTTRPAGCPAGLASTGTVDDNYDKDCNPDWAGKDARGLNPDRCDSRQSVALLSDLLQHGGQILIGLADGLEAVVLDDDLDDVGT